MGDDGFDEFDDDFDGIPDEDLIEALAQATSIGLRADNNHGTQPNGVFSSIPKLAANPPAQGWPPARPQQQSANAQRPDTTDEYDSSPEKRRAPASSKRPPQCKSGPPPSFRQTTLWGSTLSDGRLSQAQSQSQLQPTGGRPFRADLAPEAPTHHELNHDALATWVYPLNLGAIRDYQFSIVKNGLFNNTLVALPTGLGKTFIAATVMLNFIRWTKSAKVVFVAPTKPLASQQVQACLGIAGIPRSQATLLTGEIPPVLREREWETKRLFFMTPQTLINDLSKGYADPKSIVLLVVDEAHRTTGDYAYVKVVEFMRRFSTSFRVLALTATPGSTVEGVQDVIDNLGISNVEIRTEESLDIRQYVHSRNIDKVTFDPSDEMLEVRDLFSKALKPLVDKLSAQNIYYGRDPMSLTMYGLLKAKGEWLSGPGRHVNQGVKFMTIAAFTILQSLAHTIKLLNFHGIKPFYNSLAGFRSTEEEKRGGGSKLKRQVLENEHFQKMMTMMEKWMKLDTFNGHPKLTHLCQTLVNHFMDAGEGSATRSIVFSEYRDSAEEIVRMLNKQPLISATVFVGQADSKRSEGMKQKQQIETIEKFKSGTFNVLVATSIGEEGLDIGQVDLIVCYDASASPIRMLQRMGRTGRKRAGSIVLLLMKGKEEEKYLEAKDNYQKMQQLICEGSRFAFRHDLSTRIVPRDVKPKVNKRLVEIPLENSQNPSLPEPNKSAARLKKKPAKKKFHMPNGVQTGFVKASIFGQQAKQDTKVTKVKPPKPDPISDLPDLDKVVLSKSQTEEFNKLYRDLPFRRSNMEEIGSPNLGAHPAAQRLLRRTVHLKHGEYTKKCVTLFKLLGKSQEPPERYTYPYGETDTASWESLPVVDFADDTDEEVEEHLRRAELSVHKRPRPTELSESVVETPARKKRQVPAKKNNKNDARKTRAVPSFLESDCEEDDNDEDEPTTSPPARYSTSNSAPRGKKGQGIGDRFKRVGDHLEDFGDDCNRTSDMEMSDGLDSGADLEGFVVDDDQVSSSMQLLPTSPATLVSSHEARPGARKETLESSPDRTREKPFFEPVLFGPTQEETDEDMPDFTELVARSTSKEKAKRRADMRLAELSDDDDALPSAQSIKDVRKRPATKRRRPVFADSDDDG
ncbi:hypothetical protein B0T26DRAFT_732764 [Lasiosphaeria miniovina]|uniref:ATP-dependent DNA helicase n=1 Tax=Lasiosphaeria miniovina TaxID=1954250 RepID=A0AA40DL31_9PEZI|nr:uncharacterized protein B0T26DRAFT_732764 [Lasiosphaeria miniovina]KAK0703803.1 hypothetical protein B0T26DRAFT_732764 [Lasiosphaeria miniovina]